MRLPKRQCLGLTLLTGALLALPACSSDGNFTFLGYTTAPNYDCTIRTVYVPIFLNKTYRRTLEFDYTRAVIREIEAKTPYKTVSSPVGADTELICTIVSTNKNLINSNQLGEVREGEIMVGVEVLWRDLRPGHNGEILSGIGKPDRNLPGLPPIATGSKASSPPGPTPVLITPSATFIPELGGSRTSAQWRIGNNLAVQIVSMMEVWGPPTRQPELVAPR